jgi:hypothetical protein
MGMARLLAKGWIVFCIFAGAHALNVAIGSGSPMPDAIRMISVCTLLFIAMGLLFIGGYAVATDHGHPSILARTKPEHFIPSFDDLVFIAFVCLSFVNQDLYAPNHAWNSASRAITVAIDFIVPGQRTLDQVPCHLPNGAHAFASAFTWLLTLIYLCSALSHLKLSAGIIRVEHAKKSAYLSSAVVAAVFGAASILGIQLLFVGSGYALVSCSAYAGIAGALLIGLAPLMLAYLLIAAFANLLATGPE